MGKRCLILLTFLLLFSLASAVPPFQGSSVGLQVEYQKIDTTKENTPHQLNVHVYNQTGYPLRNNTVTCYFEAYAPIGLVVINTILPFNESTSNWYYDLPGTNKPSGRYAWSVHCNDSSSGGFVSGPAYVTPTGVEFTIQHAISYSIFSLLAFCMLVVEAFFLITLPRKNEEDDNGFAIKVVRLKYLRPLIAVAFYITLIILLNFLTGFASNLWFASMYYGIFGFLFQTLLALAWPFTIIIIVWIIWMLIHDTNIQKNLDKAIDFEL